jgi:hypothetical protein
LIKDRRFPPPWSIKEHNKACLIVRDNNGQALGYAAWRRASPRLPELLRWDD